MRFSRTACGVTRWIAVGVAAGVVVLAQQVSAAVTDIKLNELLINNVGIDDWEYIELYNSGEGSQSLDGLFLLSLEGDPTAYGYIDWVIDLGGYVPMPASGFFVAGDPAVTPKDIDVNTLPGPYWGPTNNFENGTETYLLVEGFTGSPGDTVDSDYDGQADPDYTDMGTIIDSVAFATDFIDNPTLPAYVYYDAPILGPVEGGDAPPGAARWPDGVDTDTPDDWLILDDTDPGDGSFPDLVDPRPEATPRAPNMPEPTTLVLLGLGGVLAMRRRPALRI